ncbi:hypothetical protein [Hyphococcus sp.]|uniref:hypothetical protein n=1 Tax=Hyphococcus sp. TaxID=2038636 RepID=UPI0020882616|nr:MAG: hypothetical protein DHS20C04_29460 [Marinicaulis sp.]
MPAANRTQPIPFYPAPSPSKYKLDHSHLTLDALRKFAQGAGSALLVFSGADSVTSSAAASSAAIQPMMDFSSLDGIVQTIFSGGLNGQMQIAAAIFLFIAAGQCIARFAGLLVAGVVIILYLQGVTAEDVLVFFQHFAQRLGAAATAFQTAEVS